MMRGGLTWQRFFALTGVAIGGSAFFGASIAAAIPGWDLFKGALWLTLSAGTGWLLLIPALYFATGQRSFIAILHSCLWAMAIGEAVLAIGGVLNFAGVGHDSMVSIVAVAISNIVMAITLARLLQQEGIAPKITLPLWILVLDGGGGLAFWLFHRLIFGGGQ